MNSVAPGSVEVVVLGSVDMDLVVPGASLVECELV